MTMAVVAHSLTVIIAEETKARLTDLRLFVDLRKTQRVACFLSRPSKAQYMTAAICSRRMALLRG